MKSWKTTAAALLVFVATTGEASGLPEKWVHVAQGVAIAFGLGVAKDHDVSGGTRT